MEFRNDIVFKAIEKHYAETGNLSVSEIQHGLAQSNLNMEELLIQRRIDEYKKSRSFKDNSPAEKKSRG
jgi:hypothetical protein